MFAIAINGMVLKRETKEMNAPFNGYTMATKKTRKALSKNNWGTPVLLPCQ